MHSIDIIVKHLHFNNATIQVASACNSGLTTFISVILMNMCYICCLKHFSGVMLLMTVKM